MSGIQNEDKEKYWAGIKKGTSLIMGMPAEEQELRIPYPAESADVPGCMALAACARDSFPGWEEAEFLAQLTQYVSRGEAWLLRVGSKIAAVLLYSKENRELAYLATAPDYRRKGLAARLVETAAAFMPAGSAEST
ncbi:MAG: GNAT family N-acetyltransferase [Faecalibacterium sp.]|nr:GNAT family N-acetyltransferase [Faecalibacterium sp.]